jgi:hypothetical protein
MAVDNPPAFPRPDTEHGGYGFAGHDGMTLRDYFAGQVVGSVMHLCARDTVLPGESIEAAFARKSYAIADAMLAARGDA